MVNGIQKDFFISCVSAKNGSKFAAVVYVKTERDVARRFFPAFSKHIYPVNSIQR